MFTVETGTGITDANALITVAELNTYIADRAINNTSTDAEKEAAIITASQDYIDTYFSINGTSLTTTQGMQIPTDTVELFSDIKRAASMGAMLHLNGRLFVAAIDVTQKIIIEEESRVGNLLDKVVYQEDGAGYTNKYPTTSIDRIMSKYTSGSSLGGLTIG